MPTARLKVLKRAETRRCVNPARAWARMEAKAQRRSMHRHLKEFTQDWPDGGRLEHVRD